MESPAGKYNHEGTRVRKHEKGMGGGLRSAKGMRDSVREHNTPLWDRQQSDPGLRPGHGRFYQVDLTPGPALYKATLLLRDLRGSYALDKRRHV